MIFRPRLSAWLLPVALVTPLAILAVANFLLSPAEWIWSLALLAIVAAVSLYNFTVRFIVDEHAITLKRYGCVVWTAPRRNLEVVDGLAGDLPFIPALIVRSNGAKVGYVLKSWFDEAALVELRRAATA